jgi:hypothetical protein
MADDLHLEDLDDEGEEVDYEDFNLEDFGALLGSGGSQSYLFYTLQPPRFHICVLW